MYVWFVSRSISTSMHAVMLSSSATRRSATFFSRYGKRIIINENDILRRKSYHEYIHRRFSSSSSSSTTTRTTTDVVTAIGVAAAAATVITSTSTTLLLQKNTTTNDEEDYLKKQKIIPNNNNNNCFSYGCMLLPRDIFYDGKSKEALERLRTDTNENTDKEKAELELFSSGNESMATLTLLGFKGGDPNHQINQDRAFCIAPFLVASDKSKNNKLLGVFDGHAKRGELVSEHSVRNLPLILARKIQQEQQGISPQNKNDITKKERILRMRHCIEETFLEVDRTAPASPSGGCTASIILQNDNELYIANAGDSRSFIAIYQPSSSSSSSNNEDVSSSYIVYQSREDKPDVTSERDRIENMGGRVYIPMRGTSRVMYLDSKTGTYSGLAMSRAIGDWDATGVIATPIIDVIDIQELVQQASGGNGNTNPNDVHIFAVSATDGMMDFVPMDVIANVIGSSLFSTATTNNKTKDHPLTACEQLIGLAANRWDHSKNGLYRDDIAIAVSRIWSPSSQK